MAPATDVQAPPNDKKATPETKKEAQLKKEEDDLVSWTCRYEVDDCVRFFNHFRWFVYRAMKTSSYGMN
jgi:hypothetical protein